MTTDKVLAAKRWKAIAAAVFIIVIVWIAMSPEHGTPVSGRVVGVGWEVTNIYVGVFDFWRVDYYWVRTYDRKTMNDRVFLVSEKDWKSAYHSLHPPAEWSGVALKKPQRKYTLLTAFGALEW